MKEVIPYKRQGDVYIYRIDNFPEGARVTDEQTKNGILAYGELSGHAHQFKTLDTCKTFQIKEYDGLIFAEIEKETELEHGRARDFVGKEADHFYHNIEVLLPGKYAFGIVQETDWLTRTVRRVAD